ncbi:hypothetical protein CPB83DRAFT_857665 [Crepidotus variabilis]|uniref:Uncharacterized protein n=1 Tax=Crepidotus variabilis TaxID=179855 RepID=A0A9P6JN67_9AGAR|nr:hypothetical protein CPB83DRAFT_857665 [Crepidotus variabilis]
MGYSSSKTKHAAGIHLIESRSNRIFIDLVHEGRQLATCMYSIRGKSLSLHLVRVINIQLIKDCILLSIWIVDTMPMATQAPHSTSMEPKSRNTLIICSFVLPLLTFFHLLNLRILSVYAILEV